MRNKEITPSLPTSSPSLDTTQVAQRPPPQYSLPEQIRRVQMVCPKSKVPNYSDWAEISWRNVLAGHCEWDATPLDQLPCWCHSTSSADFSSHQDSEKHTVRAYIALIRRLRPEVLREIFKHCPKAHNASQQETQLRWKRRSWLLDSTWSYSDLELGPRPEMIVHWTV